VEKCLMEINEREFVESYLKDQPCRRRIKWDEDRYSINAAKKKKKNDDDFDDEEKDDFFEEEEEDENPFDIEPSEEDLVEDEFPDDEDDLFDDDDEDTYR
jgi:hypothetical protein